MAKFKTVKVDYLNKTSKINMTEKYGSYNKFLEDAPIFITYYKQNLIETTTDIGMGNTCEMIGDESSITYNQIKQLPLYGVEKSTFELEYDDMMGINGGSESQGILIPNTVEPIPNDYFTVDYMDNNYLYKITNMETEDHIKSNNYYKINFKFDKPDDGSIMNQVSGKYTCLYDNIGTEDVAIIRDDILEICSKVEDYSLSIQDKYLKLYLCSYTNTLIFDLGDKSNNKYLYDPFINEFVYRNKVFVRDRSFTSHNIRPILDTDYIFDEAYFSSIYRLIETKQVIPFIERFRGLLMSGHSNYFELCGELYYKADLQCMENNYTSVDVIYPMRYGNIITYNSLIKEPLECDNSVIMQVVKIIVGYLKDELTDREILERFINIDPIYIRNDIDNFIYFPILFYIIEKSMNNIIIKK